MISIKELREWLDHIEKQGYDTVGVDDGGLTLATYDNQQWLEVGGLPIESEITWTMEG